MIKQSALSGDAISIDWIKWLSLQYKQKNPESPSLIFLSNLHFSHNKCLFPSFIFIWKNLSMIFVSKFFKKEKNKKILTVNRIQILTSRDPSSSSESEDNLKEINTLKISKLLKTTLLPIKYNKSLETKYGNYSTICTICIEEFKEGKSKVSFTPCQHVFHYKCLKDWLMKNVLNPKCPNCNYNLLKEYFSVKKY